MKPTFLPFFPLNLVAFPGEQLNLHIFEERYRQLIRECYEKDSTFGIPVYLQNTLPGLGTEMQLVAIRKVYDDGRMDISTRGIGVFKMLTFENPVAEKLYAGGDVRYIPLESDCPVAQPELFRLVEAFSSLLHLALHAEAVDPFFSFQIGHKVGLSLEDEYQLLALAEESERQHFLIKHLQKTLPILADAERTKERIRMNGHFKNLDPLTF